jgi:sulfur carrier protein ThiS
MDQKDQNFFEKYGLEVAAGEVELGKTYPIYGMITKIMDETPGHVVVEINFSIVANMIVPEKDKVEILKERAFEPGIFISTVTQKDPGVTVDCQTVVFGRRQMYSA